MDELGVIVNTKPAGKLVRENDEFIFSYGSSDAKDFISLVMQVRQKPFVYKKLHPIFEMHLPEGYLLSIIKKHFSKLTKTDDFGLLHVMAPFTKGRIWYETGQDAQRDDLTLEELLHPKNEKLFDELVARFALGSALSGVQPKVLAMVRNKATLKMDEYIVKSWGEEYPQLALNEYYCMKIVQKANIPVPEFFISEDEKLFIMKRFDKAGERYLGFEDMCVLMGKQRDDKYEGSCEQIAKTIKTFVSAQHKKEALLRFFKMTILNYRLKNGDAHLKNFGLLYSETDDVRLAPAYDVVSTTVYIKNDIPALLLLGSKKWWGKKHLVKFGIQACELTAKEVEGAFRECEEACQCVKREILERLTSEKNEEKRAILEQLAKML
jgi:serine/threonine-protein kinase HipA